jgi:RHS repeat-associated protein
MEQQTIADYPVGGAATTPTFRYVYASYIDEPVVRKTAGTGGTLVYFHRNHQYSVTAVTTSTGSIAERYAYSAYGQPTILDASGTVLQTSNFSIRYSFTGREWDATLGLHHFRARWMSPSAGRFLGRDPIGFERSMWGLYEYAESSPSINNDYSGLACWFCTSIDSVTELKNEDGKIIGCAPTYMFNDKVLPKTYNGGGPCPKDCSPVLTCREDLGDLDGKKFTKFIEPKYSGLPFLRKPYCPKKEDVDPEYCVGITAHKCNGHLPGDFKDCTDLCNRSGAVSILCHGLPFGVKQACQAFVRGSVANCIYYCETSRVKISEKDPDGGAK